MVTYQLIIRTNPRGTTPMAATYTLSAIGGGQIAEGFCGYDDPQTAIDNANVLLSSHGVTGEMTWTGPHTSMGVQYLYLDAPPPDPYTFLESVNDPDPVGSWAKTLAVWGFNVECTGVNTVTIDGKQHTRLTR